MDIQQRIAQIESLAPEAAGHLAFLTRLARLILALFRDPRVPAWLKVLTAGVASYVAMPLDALPDIIPLAGSADDIMLIFLILMQFVKRCPPDVLIEHWDAIIGDPRETVVRLRQTADTLEPDIARRFVYLADSVAKIADRLAPPPPSAEQCETPGA